MSVISVTCGGVGLFMVNVYGHEIVGCIVGLRSVVKASGVSISPLHIPSRCYDFRYRFFYNISSWTGYY